MGSWGKYMDFIDPLKLMHDNKDKVQPRTDYNYQAAGDIYGAAKSQLDKNGYSPADPYKGQLTAGRTGSEQYGDSLVSKYIRSGTPNYLQSAGNQVNATLQGDYDPRKSEYYKSYKDQIMRDAKDAQNQILHNSARSGQLHSDPRRRAESDLAGDVTGQIAQVLGQAYEAERGRQMQAVPMAGQVAQSNDQFDTNRMNAAYGYGSQPREFEQQGLDREYQDFMRQLQGQGDVMNRLAGLPSYNAYPMQPMNNNNGMQSLGQIAQLAMLLL